MQAASSGTSLYTVAGSSFGLPRWHAWSSAPRTKRSQPCFPTSRRPSRVGYWRSPAARLRSMSLDQWQYPVKWENIRRAVADGTCWLATTADGRAISTITVESTADPYWLPSDHPDDALYIHRMVVDDGARGSELGSALLDWAARRARKAGKSWLGSTRGNRIQRCTNTISIEDSVSYVLMITRQIHPEHAFNGLHQ